MSEPGEVQFVCIGCGATNPAGAEVCAGCGHRFAGPDLISKVSHWVPPHRSDDFYGAPTSPIAPPRTFRIGTALIFIALVALALGALRTNLPMGVGAIVLLAPAAIRTSIVAGRRRLEGRPMGFEEQSLSFMMTAIATWAVAISSVVAFFATCFPVGLMTSNIVVALGAGGFGTIACAVWLTRLFLGMARDRATTDRYRRYR